MAMQQQLREQSDAAQKFVESLRSASHDAEECANAICKRYAVRHLCAAIEQCSPLHRVVELIDELKDGSCLNIPGPNDETALHIAARTAQTQVVDLLLQRGAHPGVTNTATGETALFSAWAAIAQRADPQPGPRCNGFQCAASMLRAGCSSEFINTKSSTGQTVLMKAVFASHEDFVKLLLCNGADPLMSNNRGNSAVDIAKFAGATVPVQRLLAMAVSLASVAE